MAKIPTSFFPSASARPKAGTTFIHAAPRHVSIKATTAGLSMPYTASRSSGHLSQDIDTMNVSMGHSSMMSSGHSTMAPRRTRQPIACDPCRASKRKCSGGLPCDSCLRRGPSIVCHYDAASELKVRTRAELRGRTRGKRKRHSFHSANSTLRHQLSSRDVSRLRQNVSSSFSHLPNASTQHFRYRREHHPDRDTSTHAFDARASTSCHRETGRYSHTPFDYWNGDPKSYGSSRDSNSGWHPEGINRGERESMEADQRQEMEARADDSCRYKVADEKSQDSAREEEDDEDDDYMQTSPLPSRTLLDRVHLRQPTITADDTPNRENSKVDSLPARSLPSIDSLLNVSHTRASGAQAGLRESGPARRYPTEPNDDDDLPLQKDRAAHQNYESSPRPRQPSLDHVWDRHEVNSFATDASRSWKRAAYDPPSLPPIRGLQSIYHESSRMDSQRCGSPPSRHRATAGWPGRMAPELPLPHEPTYRSHGAGGALNEAASLCQSHVQRRPLPHRRDPQESCLGRIPAGDRKQMPEWIKPLPFGRHPRAGLTQRLAPIDSLSLREGDGGTHVPGTLPSSRADNLPGPSRTEYEVGDPFSRGRRVDREEGQEQFAGPNVRMDCREGALDDLEPEGRKEYLDHYTLSPSQRVPVSQRLYRQGRS